MCDIKHGELILCYERNNTLAEGVLTRIRNGEIEHVGIAEDGDMEERLRKMDLNFDDAITYKLYKLKVPDGQEVFKINYLHFFYLREVLNAFVNMLQLPDKFSNQSFSIVPNSIYSLCGNLPVTVTLNSTYKQYRKDLGLNSYTYSNPVSPKEILIIDSGVSSTNSFIIRSQKDFVQTPSVSEDEHGHGTAIASIIDDIFPKAPMHIYKIADQNGTCTEWDLLAALVGKNTAKVVNLSIAYGLKTLNCTICGRITQSARSAALEFIIENVSEKKILVAAAGNDGQNEFSYPACFKNSIAVASVNSTNNKSDFSNYSDVDHNKDPHPCVFAMYGGNKTGPVEEMFTSNNNLDAYGTSFSAATLSALIALLWSEIGNNHRSPPQMISHLKTLCDNSFTNYNAVHHGAGILKV